MTLLAGARPVKVFLRLCRAQARELDVVATEDGYAVVAKELAKDCCSL